MVGLRQWREQIIEEMLSRREHPNMYQKVFAREQQMQGCAERSYFRMYFRSYFRMYFRSYFRMYFRSYSDIPCIQARQLSGGAQISATARGR